MIKFKSKIITETLLMKSRKVIKFKLNYFNKIKYLIKINYTISIIIKNRILIKMKIIVN